MRGRSRPTIATRAPRRASPIAVAFPMPLVAPVTSTVLPAIGLSTERLGRHALRVRAAVPRPLTSSHTPKVSSNSPPGTSRNMLTLLPRSSPEAPAKWMT